MKKYEYLTINEKFNGSELKQTLNKYGEQGWELVNFHIETTVFDDLYILIFKREKQ